MTVPQFFKRKIFYIPALLVVFLGGGIFVFSRNGNGEFETQVIESSTVVHIVSETGVVKSKEDISLSFARSGRVSSVLVSKGDRVNRGETLAVLDSGSLNADLRQAQATLELEKASIEKTGIEFDNAQSSLVNAIADAYVRADDAVQAKADQLFKNPDTANPSFGITIVKSGTTFFIGASMEKTSQINSLRSQVENELNDLGDIVFGNPTYNAEETAKKTEKLLQNVQKLLSLIATSLNEYVADDTSMQTVYEGFKTDISSARTSVNTAIAGLRTAMQNYYTAQASIISQQGSTASQTIKLREIRIEDAQARIDGIQAHINDGYIISPIAGLITDVFISEGEIASVASPAISVISDNSLEISVDIPEDDIAFVDIGDAARVTFDAYDNILFNAEVVFVSPRATLVDGVSVFEVVLEFKEKDARIKAGLTVDVDIIAEEKTDVVSVPSRSVIEEDGMRFVRIIINDSSYKKQPVIIGIRGDDGVVEIRGGLEIGDNIITFINSDTLSTLKEIE